MMNDAFASNMSKSLHILQIFHCEQCPYCNFWGDGYNSGYYCCRDNSRYRFDSGRLIVDTSIGTPDHQYPFDESRVIDMPDWCPLDSEWPKPWISTLGSLEQEEEDDRRDLIDHE